MNAPRFKEKRCVSDPLRKSARGETCTLQLEGVCNHNPETVTLDHLRFFGMTGLNQKPHDFHAVYACSDCHNALDGRSAEKWGWEEVLRALMQTQHIMYQKGLLEVKGSKK